MLGGGRVVVVAVVWCLSAAKCTSPTLVALRKKGLFFVMVECVV